MTKLTISHDTFAESPRDGDNLAKFALFHGRLSLPNETPYRAVLFSSWDEFEEAITKNSDIVAAQPVYMYQHGGVALNTTGFSCPWDSGQIGFAYITREDMREAFPEWKNVSAARRERLIEIINSEVEVYSHFLNGDVYEFILEEDDEEIGSCSGFYGSDHKKSGMADYIPEEYHHLLDEIGIGEGEAIGEVA